MVRTLVFGASLKPNRYSNLVIRRLVAQGFETEAFGVHNGSVSGVQVTKKIDEITNIDIVTLYLNPELQKQYYQDILNLRPKKVIFNPGTENPELYDLLKANGIQGEVACTLVLLSTGQYGVF